MNPPAKPRVLPHELAFGLLFALTWVRLVCAAGFFARDSLLFLGLLVTAATLVVWCRRNPDEARWRVRLWFYPLAMNLSYFALKTAAPAVHPQLEDAWLQRIDSILVGGNLSLRLEPLIHPVATEFMSLCYVLFFPCLFFSWIYYHRQELPLMKKFFIGFFTAYGLGLIGYTLLPALGPHLDAALATQFTVPLKGGYITGLNSSIVLQGCNGVDCFPSLHCAVSSYILFFDRQHRPWRFKLYLVPAVGLWFSTIYLRYHYFIDVLCGFALSALCLWIANRYEPNPPTERNEHEIPASV